MYIGGFIFKKTFKIKGLDLQKICFGKIKLQTRIDKEPLTNKSRSANNQIYFLKILKFLASKNFFHEIFRKIS